MLLAHHIALWDVIASCRIEGSSDSSIRDVVPNDLSRILSASSIQAIFCNGKTSWNYYKKYQEAVTGIPAVSLPSTSPASAPQRKNFIPLDAASSTFGSAAPARLRPYRLPRSAAGHHNTIGAS